MAASSVRYIYRTAFKNKIVIMPKTRSVEAIPQIKLN